MCAELLIESFPMNGYNFAGTKIDRQPANKRRIVLTSIQIEIILREVLLELEFTLKLLVRKCFVVEQKFVCYV